MTDYRGYHCQAGYVCPAGSTSATEIPCPDGTFSDRRDLFDVAHCEMCPKGHYCPEGSTSNEVQECSQHHYCPPGSSNNFGMMLKCPAGYYAPYTRSHSIEDCLPCPAGSYCEAGVGAQTCPKGYYCPEGTSSQYQYPCAAGTYGDDTGFHN